MRATEAPSLLYDCERVVRAFYSIISTSSMHMYSTVAIFAPLDSPLRNLAAADAQPSLVVRVGAVKTWSSTLTSRATGTSDISALAFSPDGMCIACGDSNGTIQLRNTHTGTQMQVLEGHTGTVGSVSFSPTGKELLSGLEDGSVYVHDVATGARLHSWTEHSNRVCSVAWSLDGVLAASGYRDGTVRLWRVAPPKKTVVLRQGDDRTICVVFAPDGDLLSSSHTTCHIWDTQSINWDAIVDTSPIRKLGHDSGIEVVAVSSESRLVACGLYSGRIVLWNKSDGQRVRTLPGQSPVISLAFYPNNLLAAASNNMAFTLWDVSTGAPVKTISNEWADAAAFASDGLLIAHAVGSQVQIRLWPSELERDTSLLGELVQRCRFSTIAPRSTADDREPLGNSRTSLERVATSPTGKLVLAVYEDKLRIYEASTGRCKRVIRHSRYAPMTTWSPTSNLLACPGRKGVVRVWKADTGERVETITGHSERITTLVFTPDEQHILTGSLDGTIRRERIGQTSSEVLFQSETHKVIALAVSPDGQWILSGVLTGSPDTASADLLAVPSRLPVEYWGVYFMLRLHDVTGRVIWIEHHPCLITSIAFSEDCTRALAGNQEGEVFVYDLTPLIPPGHGPSPSSPPLALPEWRLIPGPITYPIKCLSFTADCRSIIADGRHALLSPEQQPLRIHSGSASSAPFPAAAYFLEDGWLWCIDLDSHPRRLCWIPPPFRPLKDRYVSRLSWSANAHVIAIRTQETRLVILDALHC